MDHNGPTETVNQENCHNEIQQSNGHCFRFTVKALQAIRGQKEGMFYLQSTEDARVLHALMSGQLSKASAEDVKMPKNLKDS